MAQIHKCGKCEEEFDTEQAYLDHTCNITGYKPADIEHQGPAFAAVSEAALARGEARKGEKEHPSVALGKKLGATPDAVVKKK